MSEKAKHQILMPTGRKSAIEKATTLKHDPPQEYRASIYRLPDSAPTVIAIPAPAFKGAMAGAALDLPGTKKAQIGRLTYVVGDYVPVYGVPQLYMAIVRSADMNRTPDVRTRAILPKWACKLTVSWVKPLITYQAVANLLAAGGITQGVGDGRMEKGKLTFGQFEIVTKDNPAFKAILASGGRAKQLDALEHPECYDIETTEMLTWYEDEIDKRRKSGSPSVASKVEQGGVM